MVDHVKSSTEIQIDESRWFAFITRSVNIVKVGKYSSFSGVLLPVTGLKLIEVTRREGMTET